MTWNNSGKTAMSLSAKLRVKTAQVLSATAHALGPQQLANSTIDPNRPVVLSADQTQHARFAFLGEFGYEIVSWIPYLLFLKSQVGVTIRTVGRPGSTVFYYFSDEHTEVDSTLVGDVWGNPDHYSFISAMFPDDILVFPGPDSVNRKRIVVAGHEWTNKNIHTKISEHNYLRPDFSSIPTWSPILGKPIIVFNNKFLRQWPDTFEHPINFFNPLDLAAIRDLLTSKGYGVVYNHFVEPTSHDEFRVLQDRGLFDSRPDTHDMRDTYAECTDAGRRNQVQLGLFNGCRLVIGPQGGNLYLPAVCHRSILVLMRAGDYVDYMELGRLYRVPVECFYEPRHLICWLERNLVNASESDALVTMHSERLTD